jgi:hypothetical protein
MRFISSLVFVSVVLSPVVLAAGQDTDGDGIEDRFELLLKTDPKNPASKPPDLDGDGIPDEYDLDMDGDGVDNWRDKFPRNPKEYADTDGNGVGNSADGDSDGDGYSNVAEKKAGTNPNDPKDFPDQDLPVVDILPVPDVVTSREFDIRGMALDTGVGIESIQATNEDGQVFKGYFDYANHFRVPVKLAKGENRIQIGVYDKANNLFKKVIIINCKP